MKHAFLITAYKDVEQLSTLLEELGSYRSEIYLHIDKRSPAIKEILLRKFSLQKNIHIIVNPVKVHWSGFSHLMAILLLLREAAKDHGNAYFHLISGQDILVRSWHEFEAFFEKSKNTDFITSFKLPDDRWTGGGLDRMKYFQLHDFFDPKRYLFPRFNLRFVNLQKWFGVRRRKPPYVQSYYGGGTWWSLSRGAVDTIMDFMKAHSRYIDYFKYTHCGEEIFFQTILSNSNRAGNIANDDLRYVNWNSKHNSCPAILDLEDLEAIRKGNYFFARKIDQKISAGLVEALK